MGRSRDARPSSAALRTIARFAAALTLLACSTDTAHDDLGVVALPIAIATDGALYRLHGTFAVRDASADGGAVRRIRSDDNPDASALEVRLIEGDYAVLLEPGWTLARRSGSSEISVPAELVGENPVTVRVGAGTRASAAFRLRVEGVVHTLEEGTLGIDVDIDERPPAVCGNGSVERGEVCDDGAQNGAQYQCDGACQFRCDLACPVRLDPSASAGGDGKTWATAVRTLAEATRRSTEIWMRGGDGLVRDATVGGSLTLRGGFDGTERTPDERRATTPRTRIPSIASGEYCRLLVERVQIGAPPTSEGADPEQFSGLSIRGCDSFILRDAALYNAHITIETTPTRFERVDVEAYWVTPLEITLSRFAWVGGSLRRSSEYATLHATDSRVLLQGMTVNGRVHIAEGAEALMVGVRFEGANSGGTLMATHATVVDSTFADFLGSASAPVVGDSLFIFNSSFVNLHADRLRGSLPKAAAIEGKELEIVASTFYQNRCLGQSCYYDVVGAQRVIGSLFVQEDPEESGNSTPGPAELDSVEDPSVLSGSCSTYAVPSFTVGPPASREVLAKSHPCPDAANASALENARKRLLELTAPYRTAFFDADVSRYDSPDWWKRRSVRAGRCTDDGAPDPGRHYDVPCPAR